MKTSEPSSIKTKDRSIHHSEQSFPCFMQYHLFDKGSFKKRSAFISSTLKNPITYVTGFSCFFEQYQQNSDTDIYT